MARANQKKRDFGIAHDGGLQHTEQIFRLQDSKDFNPTSDVVFVSIDLELSREERSKPGVPLVREFSIATLDTRHLRCLASPFPASKFISTLQFSTSHASEDFIDCDFTDFKECAFAETVFVPQADLPTTITESLRIKDDTSLDSRTLRNIIIVGQSVKTDLKVFQRLGVNVHEVAPVLAILDTDIMARNLFGANSPTPMTSFKLGAILTYLKCPYEISELHNAGNDGTLTLHAMLMLVIKSSESREIGLVQREHLDRLRAVAQMELYERQRWKPTRKSLGFYAPEYPAERDSNIQNDQSN